MNFVSVFEFTIAARGFKINPHVARLVKNRPIARKVLPVKIHEIYETFKNEIFIAHL